MIVFKIAHPTYRSGIMVNLLQAPDGEPVRTPDPEGFILGFESIVILQKKLERAGIDTNATQAIERAAVSAEGAPNLPVKVQCLIEFSPMQLESLGFCGAAKLARLAGDA